MYTRLTQDQLDAKIEAGRVRAMLRLEANEAILVKANEILPQVEADRLKHSQAGRAKRVKPLNITAKSFGVKTVKELDA